MGHVWENTISRKPKILNGLGEQGFQRSVGRWGERLQLDFSKKFRWGEKHPLMETRGDENHFSNGGDKSGAYMT